jgi:transcriptional regulator with XRE-family HTH domain
LRVVQGFGQTPRAMSLLQQTRKSRGLSLDIVAREVGTDPTNLSRVEKGTQIPKRELARALFKFYSGAVPLGAIYDPEFYGSSDMFKAGRAVARG